MVVRDRILITDEQLAGLCRRYHVQALALYGSVLREDFRDDSDIDVLVEFDPDARISLFDLSGLQRELVDAFCRDVDLVERRSVHRLIRDAVLEEARTIWPDWQAGRISAARPFRREWLHLHVMLEAADDLAEMLEGEQRGVFMANRLLMSAVIVPLRRIGAIADRLPESIRQTYVDLDWAGWATRGELLISRYYDVDWDDVWYRATVDAPELRRRVAEILAVEFPDRSIGCQSEP